MNMEPQFKSVQNVLICFIALNNKYIINRNEGLFHESIF